MKKQTLVSSELNVLFFQTVSQLTLVTAAAAMSREERGLCRWHHCDNQCLSASEQHHEDGSHGEGPRQHTNVHIRSIKFCSHLILRNARCLFEGT